MKKIISTISILSLLIFISSCRTQEEDLKLETSNDNQSIFEKGSDTIQTDSIRASRPLPTDPPPKNGHQW